jgi:sigma-B regulation protein RsbU (phosphoserine phosphatase)
MSAVEAWRIIPYEEASPFKKVRVRDEARVRAVVRHLMNDECVALLGPPMSEKSHLLRDVAEALELGGRFRPLPVDLWRTRSNDEAAFFTSLANLLAKELGETAPREVEPPTDARSFQSYLALTAGAGGSSLALLIDHLQALPHDLVHSLLVALRAAYMEREADAPHTLVAVVTGGINLVGLSSGPTSPFNIAKPVVAAPLTPEQSRALAEESLRSLGCSASINGMKRLLDWATGDRFLIPKICADSSELVSLHRMRHVTSAIAERAGRNLVTRGSAPPIRLAIRMIEEDPDTVLDVLHLLDHGSLPRSRSRQMPTRTGTDRLQLTGAVVLADGCYVFLNETCRQSLAAHFSTDRVGHILRIAGRWNEAITYLAPQRTRIARPQLLEAIVQSIYASDAPEQAITLLADGLRLGFGLADISIYSAQPATAHLVRVYPRDGREELVDLRDPGCVEAQTFNLGNYALRGTADEARLVVALSSSNRPLGVVTVEKYVENRDPHDLPEELPDLLRFLQHAAGAMENVITRAAYRAIGQAVLDAKAMQPTVERVLQTVAEALGCDYGALYLRDEGGRRLEMAAAVGKVVTEEWQAQARFPLSGRHPAVTALLEGRMLTSRGAEDAEDRALHDRFGLHRYLRIFLPLLAGSEPLGTLELGYAVGRVRISDGYKRTLNEFATQVAIAVHNMLLLRRTDEALTRKMAELSVGREIQLSLLPKVNPSVPGWQFAAMYEAARDVGGDFYDFCDLPGPPARLGVVIADVADKGVPAALFMALSRTIIRSVAISGRSPASALMRANQLILADSQADLFLSAIYLILDPVTGRVSFSNAGHNRPLLFRAATGHLSELIQRGIVLGAFDEITLQDDTLDLAPGDILVLYTDGVTDALNGDGEEFGEQRLFDVAQASAGGNAQEVLWAITGALAGFIGDTEQADDITCVVIKRE